LEPAGPAERSYSGSVNEGKAKNVSPSNESVGLAVGEINEELRAPGSGTKYPSFVPPGSSRIHPPNDNTVNSSAPLVQNSAPPARCLNKFEDERDDPGHLHNRNPEARELEGWGFLPNPSKRRHSDGDQSSARKSRDPLQTTNQSRYGSENENHSPARPVLKPTHDEEVTPFNSESSGDDIPRKSSCDEWELRRVCECPKRAPYIPAQNKQSRQLGKYEWRWIEGMLNKASEIPREITTDDFPTARSRRPIRRVVDTSGFEECETWKGTSENNSRYPKGIKDKGETHRSTHPPLWRQQVTLLSKLLRTVQQITQLLLNLLLLSCGNHS